MKHDHSGFYCLINDITISTTSKNVFNGKALKQLSSLKCADESFNSAKVLKVILNDCLNDELSDIPVATSHAKGFVALIKRLMPQITTVKIEYEGEAEDQESVTCRAFERLLSGLYSGSDTRELTLVNCGLLLPAASSTMLNLTKIETIWDTSFDETIEIIRLNAATLKTLEIACAQSTKLIKLLESSSGSSGSDYLTYPNMRILHLSSGNITQYKCKPFKREYIPFPRLEQLSLDLVYPFSDDVLFRGNTATLKYLHMAANPGTIHLLNSYNTFDKEKLKSLRHVKVDVSYVNGISDVTTAEVVVNFVMELAHKAQSLEIEGQIPKDALLSAISLPEHCTDLQILVVNDLRLSLSEILAVAEATPALSDLHCQSLGIGDDLKHLAMEHLVDHLGLKYRHVGKNFKCWKLWHNRNTTIESAATCAMLLASICPKFTYNVVTSSVRAEYDSSIRKALATLPFSKHKVALERLLFVDWDEEL
ncbi:hypothetical protein GGI19_000575 [Coemansia pectinata]|uniref:Uncharacterized protein n=1 Tax=Coemansia pectinata TaxID=1052879 RepID=A0A9W8LEB1_9FUNG|nr:hypothetical protein GGI19_000575 [Coemansia pectinata]